MSEKLHKVLAARGLGSRREIERWISAGRVMVDSRTARLGDRVSGEERIQVDGKLIARKNIAHRYLLYNKPEGEIVTRDDPERRRSVFDRLPKLKNQRWISVGRSDFNTSGLLLFTTDGDLANRLMHPSANIEREYAVRILGDVTGAAIEKMRHGVLLENGIHRFTDVQRATSTEDHQGSANHWFYVVLMRGKNREIRRLWESQGYTVSRLKRVRFGSFFIPSSVKAGQWTDLKPKDILELGAMASH